MSASNNVTSKVKAKDEKAWTPSSWHAFPAVQQPAYKDTVALKQAIEKLHRLPPLTTPQEVDGLLSELAEVAEGKRFLLQGGDCAERFDECSSENIEKKLKVLIQMALILTWGGRQRVVKIARIAGQYSKPRSKDTEILKCGKEVNTFRGDNVNSFDPKNRDPDPDRLVQGYFHSAATLNFMRGLLSSGFADLSAAKHWSLGFVVDKQQRKVYSEIVEKVMDAVSFANVCGFGDNEEVHKATIYTSHEGLSLPYEEAMTVPARKSFASKGRDNSSHAQTKHYNLGSHFIWIGNRTRQLDHAHVEYCRGIRNPIGIKIGPKTPPEDVVPLIRKLWPCPAKAPGKITLITRFGAHRVRELLPAIIRPVLAAGLKVVWSCDPMHGNTRKTDSGIKTRHVTDVLSELRLTFQVHKQLGSSLQGVHLEMTGENVTECVGGPEDLFETDLPKRYTSYCDPRLNYAQSLQVAFLLTQHLRERKETGTEPSSPPARSRKRKPAEAGLA